MTRYFSLEDDVEIPMRWHLGRVTLADGTEPRFRIGMPFASSETPRIRVARPGRALDFCFTSYAVPLATTGLASAVCEIAGTDVQCIPADIADHSGIVILNSLRVVRCVDEHNSRFSKWTAQDHRADLAGQYRSITKLVLDRDAVPPDAHFFRIDGSTVDLIVSEAVKNAMESTGCLGATFTELQLSRVARA